MSPNDGVQDLAVERFSASHCATCGAPLGEHVVPISTAPSLATRLLNAVNQAVIATDLDGIIVYWNRFAEQLYGWPASEVLGQQVLEVTPSRLSQSQAAAVFNRLQRGETWSGELLVRRRDGSEFTALVTDAPLLDANGALVGIVGVSADLTEVKQVAEALCLAKQEAARLDGVRLTAREISHLLNNDLQLPLIMLSLLQRRSDLPEDARACVDRARTSLAEAAEHVQQLQQVVRVETKPTPTGPALDLHRSTDTVAS
jgi:PAS domain S-box-containing protein